MLYITTIENEEALSGMRIREGLLDLRGTEQIERNFRLILEWEEQAFRDAKSLECMKRIDGAVRQGDYGVVTPVGKSCITCLSTGCKMGLLLLYYKDNGRGSVLTEFAAAGENVWEYLGMNEEIRLRMLREDAYRGFLENVSLDMKKGNWIRIDGLTYSQGEKNLRDECRKYLDELFVVTREKEAHAYRRYTPEKYGVFRGYFREEVTLRELYQGIAEENEVIDPEDAPDGYRVINYCTEIPNRYRYSFRKAALWVVGRRGTKYEFRTAISVKYPTLLELLHYDVIEGYVIANDGFRPYDPCYYRQMYEEYLVLVLDAEERCEVRTYPEHALYGVWCHPGEKLVTIYTKNQAIEKFHEMMTQGDEIQFVGE